jgi:hypothetical protein
MTAAYTGNVSTPGGVLHLAFELGWTHWKLDTRRGQFTVVLRHNPFMDIIGPIRIVDRPEPALTSPRKACPA